MSTPPQSLKGLLLTDMVCANTHKPQPPHQWAGQKIKFVVCAEGMMSDQLHGVVLMVLLFDVLVFLWFSFESSRQWWSDGAGCGLWMS